MPFLSYISWIKTAYMCLHTCITVSRWLIAPVHKALGNTARHWGGKDKDLFWRKYLSASTRFASGQSDHSSMASNSWAGAGSRHSNFGWPSPLLINSGINSHTLRPKRTGYTLSPHVKGKPVLEIGNNKPVKPQPTNIISSKIPFSINLIQPHPDLNNGNVRLKHGSCIAIDGC